MTRAAPPVRAALCDLDGTLLDTAPDLAAAVNRMLADLGLPLRTLGQVANDIGRGTAKLVERSIGAHDPAVLERALRLFSGYYEQDSGASSRPYPGVAEGLEAMAQQGLALACVTNKPRRFTVPLLERTALDRWFDTTVCGDEVARLKPDAAPYAEACRRLQVAPGAAVVIGDSSNDVIAARAAGCPVICVPYGYREGEPAEALRADALVADFRAAADWIRALNGVGLTN